MHSTDWHEDWMAEEWQSQYNTVERLRKRVAELERVVAVARSYVDALSNHPQVAGEMWRELVAALAEGETK
jgi:hypothetical protein